MVSSGNHAKVSTTIRHVASSGNVFEDLGVSAPDEAQARAASPRGFSGALSRSFRGSAGRLSGISTDSLVKFVIALGRDVDIVIRARPKGKRHGHLQVVSE